MKFEENTSKPADYLEKLDTLRQKSELSKLVTVILENSTVMPFRWHGNKYMCFYCCCSFADSRRLKEHTGEEHSEIKLKNIFRSHFGRSSIKLDITKLTCKRCGKEMQDLDQFLEHASKDHQLKFSRDACNNILCFELSDECIRCLECGQNFKFFGPLLSHVHKLHNKAKRYLCDVCGQDFLGKNTMDSHIKAAHNNVQHCDKCKSVFSSQSALKTHFERVHRTGRLRCPKCPLILASKYLKKKHLALVHDVKSVQFNCEQCSKIFTAQSKLLEHKQRVHLKEKKVTCEVCGFKVFNKDLLKRHMVKHDDSRPFECEFCKKAFQRKKTLEFHIRIHTNDRRYACKECGRAFVQQTSLKSHLRIHHSNVNENNSWT